MKRFLMVTALSALFAMLAVPAGAATLQVYPVNVDFCGAESAQAIYVKNTGSAPIGAQIRVYAWQQRDNQDRLTDTDNLLVSPPMTRIPAGRQQLIRVILPTPAPGGDEQAYRLVVDELPGENNMALKDGVRFLLRYSIPVFVHCASALPSPQSLSFTLDTHRRPAVLKVRNNGAQHIKLSNITLMNHGHQLSAMKGLLGYVLPHSEKEWPLPQGSREASSLSLNLNDNAQKQTFTFTP